MGKWKVDTSLRLVPYVILIIALVMLLSWHWRAGIARFLDADEFSYLHWSAQVARGQIPYRDFFLIIPPGFMVIFAPLFWMFKTPDVFLAARVIHFFIFVGTAGLLSVLFGITRGWKWSLLPAVLLAFLPMPFDKFFEVRPDNLSTFFALGGLVCQVLAMNNRVSDENKRGRDIFHHFRSWWGASGFLYALSLLILPKTLPFAIVAGLVWLAASWRGIMIRKEMAPLFFITGFAIPFLAFLFWSLWAGLPNVLYSLTTMAIEANQFGNYYIMEPHLFFFPNGAFYGGSGMTAGFIANHALWTLGLLFGVVRLMTPFITANGERHRVWTELLIGGISVLGIAGYIVFFPLKHSQYLIPIALFVCFYAAEALSKALDWLEANGGAITVAIILAVGAVTLLSVCAQINQPKLALTNELQIAQTEALQQLIAPDMEVFDLDGRIFWAKDAYYICCIPMGEFIKDISRTPAGIGESLERKKVPYIFQGDSGRLERLPSADVAYIHRHYLPVEGWGEALWRRK